MANDSEKQLKDLLKEHKGEKIIVKILGSEILESNYSSVNNCALAKATKRYFDTDDVCVGGVTLSVCTRDFLIDINQFNSRIFEELKRTITNNQANEVVVEVELTYYKDLE